MQIAPCEAAYVCMCGRVAPSAWGFTVGQVPWASRNFVALYCDRVLKEDAVQGAGRRWWRARHVPRYHRDALTGIESDREGAGRSGGKRRALFAQRGSDAAEESARAARTGVCRKASVGASCLCVHHAKTLSWPSELVSHVGTESNVP